MVFKVSVSHDDGPWQQLHNGTHDIGRSWLGISDAQVSRKQIRISVDSHARTATVCRIGINPSKLNAVPLQKDRIVELKDNDLLNLVHNLHPLRVRIDDRLDVPEFAAGTMEIAGFGDEEAEKVTDDEGGLDDEVPRESRADFSDESADLGWDFGGDGDAELDEFAAEWYADDRAGAGGGVGVAARLAEEKRQRAEKRRRIEEARERKQIKAEKAAAEIAAIMDAASDDDGAMKRKDDAMGGLTRSEIVGLWAAQKSKVKKTRGAATAGARLPRPARPDIDNEPKTRVTMYGLYARENRRRIKDENPGMSTKDVTALIRRTVKDLPVAERKLLRARVREHNAKVKAARQPGDDANDDDDADSESSREVLEDVPSSPDLFARAEPRVRQRRSASPPRAEELSPTPQPQPQPSRAPPTEASSSSLDVPPPQIGSLKDVRLPWDDDFDLLPSAESVSSSTKGPQASGPSKSLTRDAMRIDDSPQDSGPLFSPSLSLGFARSVARQDKRPSFGMEEDSGPLVSPSPSLGMATTTMKKEKPSGDLLEDSDED